MKLLYHFSGWLALAGALLGPSTVLGASENRLSDQPIPLQTATFPKRPEPIVEIGQNPFLGPGFIYPGFISPTGAVWQPVFIAYGTLRSSYQTFDSGPAAQLSEWSNRLDLFGNLYLTPTERILASIRPLDRDGRFSNFTFKDPTQEGWHNSNNGNLRTLFFEGDFGELFPTLDPTDRRSLDYGFAVGRMPISLQDGIMFNDGLDGIGLTRSSLFLLGSNAAHVTAFYGWSDVHHGARKDLTAQVFLLSAAADYSVATVEADFAYVPSRNRAIGDGLFAGFAYIARLGKISSTTRVNFSRAIHKETADIQNGALWFQQLNYQPAHTHNNLYLNLFAGFDSYRSAARSPEAGGPLGQAGLLFAAVGLGRYGAALGNTADRSMGGSVGYQMFFKQRRQQLNIEVGERQRTDRAKSRTAAVGARYQHAFGRHVIWQLDGFTSTNQVAPDGYGFRSELQYKF